MEMITQEPRPVSHQVAVSETRELTQVQSAVAMAKRFPRDETAAFARVVAACKRRRLAEAALYAYPRGGEVVTGPSIRLAEAVAQAWGNMDFGVRELETGDGSTLVESYAWDLETNTRVSKSFRVPHVRQTRRERKVLTDPRDVYELVANSAARRLRACILGVIPGDVIDEAVAVCRQTMESDAKESLQDRVRKMVAAFESHGVTQSMIERRLGHPMAETDPAEFVDLTAIFKAVRDNPGSRGQFFEHGEVPDWLGEQVEEKPKRKGKAKKEEPAQD